MNEMNKLDEIDMRDYYSMFIQSKKYINDLPQPKREPTNKTIKQ